MKITNFLILKNCLFISLAIFLVSLLLTIFLRSEYIYIFLCIAILNSSLSTFFLFRRCVEIVIGKDGVHFNTKSFFYSLSNSQEKNFVSFSYLNECKVIHGIPITFSFKYFKRDGKYCVKKLTFFIDRKKATEVECFLNKKIWGVK